MANEQNLRPSEYKLSQEEAKRGGIRSGEVRRENAIMKKTLNLETYESPNTDVFTIETEGAILADSLNGVGHDDFDNGGNIPF